MKDTERAATQADALVSKAKRQLIDDMEAREISAIIWDNHTAGFHYVPEIVTGTDKDGNDVVCRVTGLYAFGDNLYAIEENAKGTDMADYYRHGVDVPPTVVTLGKDLAARELGNPVDNPDFTLKGTNPEWLAIADCYFEALAL